MSSPVPSRAAWFRIGLTVLTIAWLVGLPVVMGAAGWAGYGGRLPLVGHLALGGLWLATLALLVRRGWLPSPGPVFFYDLVRSSRRGEVIAHRCFYAVLLVGILLLSYWRWFPDLDLTDLMQELSLRSMQDRARFAGSFFAGFMALQFAVVLLLTPTYTAGAIADERERRTLEYLLVTDLSDREIVLGALASRLARLLLLVLTGLPILSLLPLWGGVEPRLVLTGYIATAALMLSLGSLSILMSAVAPTTLRAVAGTYLVLPLFLCLALLPYPRPLAHPVWAVVFPASPDAARPRGNLEAGLAVFVTIQVLIAVGCCAVAVTGLRRGRPSRPERRDRPVIRPLILSRPGRPPSASPLPLEGGEDKVREVAGWGPYPEFEAIGPFARRRRSPAPSPVRRPPIGANALLWKEVYLEKGFGFPSWIALAPFLGAAALVLPALLFFGWLDERPNGEGLGPSVQPVVRKLGALLGGILLLIVAVSAAGRISRERERQTLDPLLALPVDLWDIVFTKWLGSILSVRGLWWLLGGVWVLGMAAGALSPFAVLLLAAAWAVCAAFLAALGLWLSATCGTTLRAILFTLLAALLFVANPVGVIGTSPFAGPGGPEGWLGLFGEAILNPSGALETLAFRPADLANGSEGVGVMGRLMAAVAGLHVYLIATPLLWLAALARLRAGKGPSPRQEAKAPAASRREAAEQRLIAATRTAAVPQRAIEAV